MARARAAWPLALLAVAAGCGPLEPAVIIGRETTDAGHPPEAPDAEPPRDAGAPRDAGVEPDGGAARPPDLVLTEVEAAPASWVPGSGRTLRLAVLDLGAPAPPTAARLELVAEADPADRVELGVAAVPALGPGGRATLAVPTWVPAATPPGRYRVEATVDPEDNVAESDEANNRRSAGLVWVSAVEVSPGGFDFGVVGLGCTATQTLSLRNRGQSPAYLSTVSPTDPAGPFRLDGVPALPLRLGSGEALSLPVVYAPRTAGAHQATLTLVHDQLGIPLTLPASGAGADRPLRRERFTAWPQRRVDVLVVVDDSPTMLDEAAAVQAGSGALVALLEDLQIDFHIGVTTTDMGASGPRGLLVGRTPLITPDTPQPAHTFAANLRVGVGGAEDERGLEAAAAAFGGLNPGFRRPEAAAAVLWFSDEDDQGATPAPELAEALLTLTGRRGALGWAAWAVVSVPERPCATASEVGDRYRTAAEALGGVAADLCTFQWATATPTLLPAHLGRQVDFPLAWAPLAGTLEVTVDGRPTPSTDAAGRTTWNLDAAVLRFAPDAAPPPGAAVRVSYRSGC
jgi:hypothetical protein